MSMSLEGGRHEVLCEQLGGIREELADLSSRSQAERLLAQSLYQRGCNPVTGRNANAHFALACLRAANVFFGTELLYRAKEPNPGE